MPTLYYIYGLRFFFYSEEHLPIHIHVENGDGRAKVNVYPEIRLVENNSIKPQDIRKALQIISVHQEDIIDKWKEFHGE